MMNVYVQLVRAYAMHIEAVLPRATKMVCYGCFVDHPSPSQHDVCIMMSEEECIKRCLRKCLQIIDEVNVMKTFNTNLDVMEILRCENSLMFYNKNNRKQLWLRREWVEDVVNEIVRIRVKHSKQV